nr:hypothetical protein [Aureimonas sp. AU4]
MSLVIVAACNDPMPTLLQFDLRVVRTSTIPLRAPMAGLRTVYRSPNGDDWLVERNEAGTVVAVVHQANPASGGTRTPVGEFLERAGSGPEVTAVRAAIAR